MNKRDQLALYLSGTYCHKAGTRPPSCVTPWQPTPHLASIEHFSFLELNTTINLYYLKELSLWLFLSKKCTKHLLENNFGSKQESLFYLENKLFLLNSFVCFVLAVLEWKRRMQCHCHHHQQVFQRVTKCPHRLCQSQSLLLLNSLLETHQTR